MDIYVVNIEMEFLGEVGGKLKGHDLFKMSDIQPVTFLQETGVKIKGSVTCQAENANEAETIAMRESCATYNGQPCLSYTSSDKIFNKTKSQWELA